LEKLLPFTGEEPEAIAHGDVTDRDRLAETPEATPASATTDLTPLEVTPAERPFLPRRPMKFAPMRRATMNDISFSISPVAAKRGEAAMAVFLSIPDILLKSKLGLDPTKMVSVMLSVAIPRS
jgi:hypothetical protein